MADEPHRVLIVEDNAEIRNMIEQFLDIQGFDVIGVATDGAEGLEMYRLKHPDAIVTDLRMPKVDGLQLVEAVRREDDATPIVIFTAYATGDPRLQDVANMPHVKIVAKTRLRELGPTVLQLLGA
jgi:CheY-like chemotaxis protein